MSNEPPSTCLECGGAGWVAVDQTMGWPYGEQVQCPNPRCATEPPSISFLFPCEECGAHTDPEWWFRSGQLCGDCLAGYGMPLTRVEEWMERHGRPRH